MLKATVCGALGEVVKTACPSEISYPEYTPSAKSRATRRFQRTSNKIRSTIEDVSKEELTYESVKRLALQEEAKCTAADLKKYVKVRVFKPEQHVPCEILTLGDF